jgi:predicted dehydrogenase
VSISNLAKTQKSIKKMISYSRRKFLSKSLAVGAGASFMTILPKARAGMDSRNDAIQLGIIGVGSKASGHIKQLREMKGVRIVALCDVDPANLAKGQALLKEKGFKAKEYVDMRNLLDDASVDAVIIITPNHWHALATVWACQAGKDVYVEKPVTHNLWEGQKMVEAARKYGRIVQAGTQNRSDSGFIPAIEYLREGNLGKILWTHGVWYKERDYFGPVTGPQPIPAGVDYNLWTGPAPLKPLMRKRLHYDWHWNWDTGNGDMGNLGGHQTDDSVNIVGMNGTPKRFLSLGGLYLRDDGWQTPNVQAVFIEYENKPSIIVDIRSLPAKSDAKYMVHLRQVRRGNIIQCEGGYFAGGRFGGIVYDNDRKRIKEFPGDGGLTHFQNWLDAIRTRDNTSLRAEIAMSVNSANLCHFANLAYRSGLPTSVKEMTERLGNNDHAVETVRGIASHVEANGVDLKKSPLTCSEWMEFDPEKLEFSGSGEYANSIANALAKPRYRAPFVVPDKV